MSKIICDVCGTSYPDTAAQCPICGCAQAAGATAANEADHGDAGYAAVKGGRFSKANVNKRNKEAGIKPMSKAELSPKKKSSGNGGLMILALVLVAAIIAVLIYIVVKFIGPGASPSGSKDTTGSNTTTTSAMGDTQANHLDCTDLEISKAEVTFTSEGQVVLLNVKPVPADTDDIITYESSDASVATVTTAGRIMAIAPGEATITVTCGDVVKTVEVLCNFGDETTAPDETTEATEPTETDPDEGNDTDLKLNRDDVTFSYQGEVWQVYDGDIAEDEITWTSSDKTVVTVEDGEVTAVGPGTATVTAEYKGQKVSCIFRCAFTVEPDETLADDGFDTGVSEEGNSGSGDDTPSQPDDMEPEETTIPTTEETPEASDSIETPEDTGEGTENIESSESTEDSGSGDENETTWDDSALG